MTTCGIYILWDNQDVSKFYLLFQKNGGGGGGACPFCYPLATPLPTEQIVTGFTLPVSLLTLNRNCSNFSGEHMPGKQKQVCFWILFNSSGAQGIF